MYYILVAETLGKMRMLHRVETTFYGASFACSFGVFLLRVSVGVFLLWSSLLGSFAVCSAACVPVCPSCVSFLCVLHVFT